MNPDSKVYIAGHSGLVGSALVRHLSHLEYDNLLLMSSKDLDLTKQAAVEEFFLENKPDYVFLAAAKVGGIKANDNYSAEFIYHNLMIQTNVIHSAYMAGVKKLLFLGSSCIYPKYSKQPIKEEYLLTEKLEPTNEAYAVAKIAGIKMVQAYRKQYGVNFISAMPTNLYGPGDNYDLDNAHVLAALIRKFHEAKSAQRDSVEIWGTGKPKREFLHVDDLAEAAVFLMDNYDSREIINVGSGKDIAISELAMLIKDIVGYEGQLQYNFNKPDGTPRKLLDISRMTKLGWQAKIGLKAGIENTYKDYIESV